MKLNLHPLTKSLTKLDQILIVIIFFLLGLSYLLHRERNFIKVKLFSISMDASRYIFGNNNHININEIKVKDKDFMFSLSESLRDISSRIDFYSSSINIATLLTALLLVGRVSLRYLQVRNESQATSLNSQDVSIKDNIDEKRDDFKRSFGSGLLSQQTDSSAISNIFQYCEFMRNRVLNEISSLTRRANVNLIIGGTTTVVAIVILLYTAFNTSDLDPIRPQHSNIVVDGPLVYSIAIRMSTVVFIEVFAFFFLRLYRNGLSEIKYYQNELTNIDFKILAINAAIFCEDTKNIDEVIKSFLKVERNFVLQRGQSTIEIESLKFQTLADQSFVEKFNSLSNTFASLVNKASPQAKTKHKRQAASPKSNKKGQADVKADEA